MNLYLLTQEQNTCYDTYDSMIVCNETEEDAKEMLPYSNGEPFETFKTHHEKYSWEIMDWATSSEYVNCKLIGIANENIKIGIILTSFNAG